MKTRLLSACCAALLMPAGLAGAQTVLNVSSWMPAQDATTRGLMTWCAEVSERTENRITCRLLPAPVASPLGTFDAVRDGLADVSFTLHGYVAGRFFLTQMAEMPLLGDDAEAVSVAWQRVYDEYVAPVHEDEGVHTLAVFTHGGGEVYMANRPVRSIDEFAGLKLRGGGGMLAQILEALQVTAVLAPATELYSLMSNGVVDGTVASPAGVMHFDLAPIVGQNLRVPGGLYNSSFGIFMNQDTYDGLDPADRAVVDELSGVHLSRIMSSLWAELDHQGQQAIEAAGGTVTVADEAFVAALIERTRPIEEAWIAGAAERGVDGAAALAALRAAIAEEQASR